MFCERSNSGEAAVVGGDLEDTENIQELKRHGVAVSIKETDLARIDMHAINDLVADNIVRVNLDVNKDAVGGHNSRSK